MEAELLLLLPLHPLPLRGLTLTPGLRGTYTANEGPDENPIEMSGSHLCMPRNENVLSPYFQNGIIKFSLPIPTLLYL